MTILALYLYSGVLYLWLKVSLCRSTQKPWLPDWFRPGSPSLCTICSCTIQQNPLRCLVAWHRADPVTEEPIRGSVGGRNIMIEDNNWMGWLTDSSMVHENILYCVEYYWAEDLYIHKYPVHPTQLPVYKYSGVPVSILCKVLVQYSVLCKTQRSGAFLSAWLRPTAKIFLLSLDPANQLHLRPHFSILHDSTPSRRGVSCLFLQKPCYFCYIMLSCTEYPVECHDSVCMCRLYRV